MYNRVLLQGGINLYTQQQPAQVAHLTIMYVANIAVHEFASLYVYTICTNILCSESY